MSINNEQLLVDYRNTNSLKIKDKIIRNNGGMVKEIIARKFDYPHIYEDLYQEGLIALGNAIDKYDSSKKINFSTFAYTVVKNRLINYVRNEKRSISFEPLADFYESRPQSISSESFLEMLNPIYKDVRNRFFEAVVATKTLNRHQKKAFNRMKKYIKAELI